MLMKQGLAASLLSLSLTACVNLSATHPPALKSYQLNRPSQAASPWLKTHRTIAVREGYIAPAFRGTGIVYQIDAEQVNYFVSSRWQALASTMITSAIADTLQTSTLFKAIVISPPYVGAVDQTISVNLLALTQVFDKTLQHSVEHVVIQLAISDRLGNLQTVKNFTANIPARATPLAGVTAANIALQQLLPQMLRVIYDCRGID